MTAHTGALEPRYSHYRVAVYTPDGVVHAPWCGAFNSRFAYDKWRAQLGKTCTRVELWGRQADGSEGVLELCDLRSDLHAGVKTRTAESVQMELL